MQENIDGYPYDLDAETEEIPTIDLEDDSDDSDESDESEENEGK